MGASMGLLGKPLGGHTRLPRSLLIATAVPCLLIALKCLFFIGKFDFGGLVWVAPVNV